MQRKNKIIKNKKVQITIFVIIAIVLVAAFVLVFMLLKTKIARVTMEEEPTRYLEKCIEDSLEKTETALLDGNGYINKTDNYILYFGKKVPYLCKASQFYNPCINQEPMFIEHIREEFEKQAREDIEDCFSELKKNLERKGYYVNEEKNWTLKVEFREDAVSVNVNKKLTLKRDDETRSYEKFQGQVMSPIYKLAKTAITIVNFESTLCEFNHMNWMRYFPDISIKKFVASDATKIYTIEDRESKKSISIAIKTCVFPAGI